MSIRLSLRQLKGHRDHVVSQLWFQIEVERGVVAAVGYWRTEH